MKKLLSFLGLILFFSAAALGQTDHKKPEKPAVVASEAVRGSAAYAELLLIKTELESDLDSLLIDYTDEYPKIKESRYRLSLMQRDMERIAVVKPADTGKLTAALGKLMLRRIELETDLWSLKAKYEDAHPEVKRARRKVEIFDAAIKEILG
jgi:hypothetical protein